MGAFRIRHCCSLVPILVLICTAVLALLHEMLRTPQLDWAIPETVWNLPCAANTKEGRVPDDETGTACVRPGLEFRADQTFKMVQFADLHFGEDARKDEATQRAMRTVLRREAPVDLVVLSGDMVSGFAWSRSLTPRWFETRWRHVTAPMERAGVPYASVLGNHDAEADAAALRIGRLAHESSRLCLTPFPGLFGRRSKRAHYFLEVCSSAQGESSEEVSSENISNRSVDDDGSTQNRECLNRGVGARIWMMDSGNRGCQGASPKASWGCVESGDVQVIRALTTPGQDNNLTQEKKKEPAPNSHWEELPEEIRGKGPLHNAPSLAFVHIPPPEFLDVWDHTLANGSKGEHVCCPRANSGLVSAFREGGVSAIYSGHDHNNDYIGMLPGEPAMRLAYGRKSGYGSYGPGMGALVGARVILLREGQNPAFSDTWIRLESGRVERQTRRVPMSNKLIPQVECAS